MGNRGAFQPRGRPLQLINRNFSPHRPQQHLDLLVRIHRRNHFHRAGYAPNINPVAALQPFRPRRPLYRNGLPLGRRQFPAGGGQRGLPFLQVRCGGRQFLRNGRPLPAIILAIPIRGVARRRCLDGLRLLHRPFRLLQLLQQSGNPLLQLLPRRLHQIQTLGLHRRQPPLRLPLLRPGLGQKPLRLLPQLRHQIPLPLQFPNQFIRGDKSRRHQTARRCQNFRRQAEAVGNGQGVTAPRQTLGQPVSRRQSHRRQVNAGIDHPRLFLGIAGHAAMVGRGNNQNAALPEMAKQGLGQRRPLLGIGAGPQFVNQNQGLRRSLRQNGPQVLDVGAESG